MKLLEAIKQKEEHNNKAKELETLIAKASFRHCKPHYSYGFYVEDKILKFYIKNNDGYEVRLYHVSLKELIKDLKRLDKIIKEAELKKEKEANPCKKS